MYVKQFRYLSDNLGYLICGKDSAIAIDGGAVKDILDFVRTDELNLKYVTNSHTHMDHIVGNSALLNASEARFLDIKTLLKNRIIELDGEEIQVHHTPGHTSDSVIFHLENILITGDTLLNGKVGRCFSGDLKGFFKSVKLIMGFPEETIIYGGHDYVEEYMAFVRGLEPGNPYIDDFLKKYDPDNVHSTLDEEFKINPFLRFNEEVIISILKERGLPVGSEYERWKSIMSLI